MRLATGLTAMTAGKKELMKSAIDITEKQIALLKTVALEDVCQVINSIVMSFCDAKAVGIIVWDQDFEAFSDKYAFSFGELADQFDAFLAEFASKNSDDWDFGNQQLAAEINAAEFASVLAEPLQPVFCYKVVDDATRIGMIFVAGDTALNTRELQEHLGHFPIKNAIANAFEMAELRREVSRLRDQYEQLENAFHEQKQAAASVSPTYTFRMEQTDKEKLVYEISNAVRSSLEIEEVLQTAVNKIGATFQLSRCLVLWPMPASDEYTVYEWFHESVASGKSLFFTTAGNSFVRLASSKSAPTNFADETDQHAFDKDYLRQFGFLSGMLVPLIYHDRNIGSLFLQDCMMPREWSIDNTALIGSLADLISVAIEHSNMHEEKKRQAVTDGLTGISNRRHFNDTMEKEFERARRYGYPLSLVIVDLDYLKKINDTYGHHVGDEAIKTIGKVLAKECRAVDTAARYGGEEFCLLLPDTDSEDAMNLAERIRKLISETPLDGPGTVTASIGVATFPSHVDNEIALFEAADQALYAAKQSGRNRVCIAPD